MAEPVKRITSGGDMPSSKAPGAPRWKVAATLGLLLTVAGALPVGFALYAAVHRYSAVHALDVLTVKWTLETALFLIGGGLAAVLVKSSCAIAYRTRPIFLPMTEEDMLLENYRGALERYRNRVEWLVVAFVALFAGASASGQWQKLALWWHGTTFGVADPAFGKDAGFYVFTVPWCRFLLGFSTMCLALALLAAVVAHVLHGGLTMRGIPIEGGRRTTRAARRHLAVLLVLFFLVRAFSSTLSGYELATAPGTDFGGMNYTGEHVLEPSYAVLGIVSMCVAGMLLSVWRADTVRLPFTGAAVFVVLSIVGMDIAVPLYDRLAVQPHAARLEPVRARQAMTAQAEAFGLTGMRQETLPVGAVGASSKVAGSSLERAVAAVPWVGTSTPPGVSNGRVGRFDAGAASARVGRVAPWLTLDRHPYVLGSGGARVWVIDGYTTSASYPGSQPYRLGADSTASGSGNGRDVNYVRRSVTALVNAKGDVTLYAQQPKEPILRAWQAVFDTPVRPMSAMAQQLRDGLRYPQDLFEVQCDVVERYHPRSTSDFLGGSSWQAASQPDAQPPGMPAAPLYGPLYGSVAGRGSAEASGWSAVLVSGGAVSHARGVLTASDGPNGGLSLASVSDADADALPDPGAWSREVRSSTQPGVGQKQKLSDVVAAAEKRETVTFGPVATLRVGSGVMYAQQVTSVAQGKGAKPHVIAVLLRSGRVSVWGANAGTALKGLLDRTSGGDTRAGALADAQQALEDANTAQARGDNAAYAQAGRRLQAALDRAKAATK